MQKYLDIRTALLTLNLEWVRAVCSDALKFKESSVLLTDDWHTVKCIISNALYFVF